MSASRSVRLSPQTRDAINKIATERGLTADRAILAAIQALRDEEWRHQAEREAWEMAHDPVDRALVADVAAFMDGREMQDIDRAVQFMLDLP